MSPCYPTTHRIIRAHSVCGYVFFLAHIRSAVTCSSWGIEAFEMPKTMSSWRSTNRSTSAPR